MRRISWRVYDIVGSPQLLFAHSYLLLIVSRLIQNISRYSALLSARVWLDTLSHTRNWNNTSLPLFLFVTKRYGYGLVRVPLSRCTCADIPRSIITLSLSRSVCLCMYVCVRVISVFCAMHRDTSDEQQQQQRHHRR